MKQKSKSKFLCSRAMLLCLLLGTSPCLKAQLTPTRLRCEHLQNPLGIDVLRPRLSWQLRANADDPGQYQTARRILVASSREKLQKNQGDLWDSGIIQSDTSVLVPYKGTALQSRQRCWWKVKVWDARREPGPWSDIGFWEMGFLRPADWQAEWIACSAKEISPPPTEPAPIFRKEFFVRKNVRRARIYITGLGYFYLSLNGKKVGDHELDPVKSRYDRRVYYLTFDITDMLRTGQNAAGVMLGTGWYNMHTKAVWGFGQAPWRARPRMLCRIEIEYKDGRTEKIVSNGTWKVSTGPVVFDGIRNGETYDARLEKPGWDTPGYDDSDWKPAAAVAGPGGEMSAQMLPPIRTTRTLGPRSVQAVKPGVWVFDFGQNIAGKLQISLNAPAGTTIRLKQGERLYEDGTVQQKEIARFIKSGELQTDTYICKGEGQEQWEPRFVYHGFQYVEVHGLPGRPTKDFMHARVLNTDLESAGRFECSKELFNQIQHCTRWSFTGNYHGIPTDCPHREKIGWTGDAHLVAETGLFNYDMAAAYSKWLRDFRDEQRENGDLPGIVPTSGWGYQHGGNEAYRDLGYGPQWEGAFVILPWTVYVYTGDTKILKDNYRGFCRYLDHLTRHAEGGLILFGIDDHAPARTKTGAGDFATGFYYQIARIVSQTAALLGHSDDAARYERLAESIAAAFNRHLFDAKTGTYGSGSQTAQSAPLYFGMAPPDHRERVLQNLVANVKKHNDHLDTGVVGTKFLINSLVEHGRAGVAYRIISQTTFPGWGDWMRKGANTLWQKWDDGMSRNHIMFGDISAWMFKYIGGLQPDPDAPGFKHFFIAPHFFHDLSWADAEHHSPYGTIRCAWRRNGGEIEMEVVVPVNSSATIKLPAPPAQITQNGRPVEKQQKPGDVKPGGLTAIDVTAGRYVFRF